VFREPLRLVGARDPEHRAAFDELVSREALGRVFEKCAPGAGQQANHLIAVALDAERGRASGGVVARKRLPLEQ